MKIVVAVLAAVLAALPAAATGEPVVGSALPRWTEGALDIHQIATGRGNAALLVFPDGTTLLVDAGATGPGLAPESDPHPDDSRTPGEWITRYVQRHAPEASAGLDYAMLTHFHIDHMGQVLPESTLDPGGLYRLTGITEVGTHLRIGTLVDRGWPTYDYPAPLQDPLLANYRAFLEARRPHGLQVERFRSGARDQFRMLRGPERYPRFVVRNIVGNGEVWTGEGDATRALFPPLDALAPADRPNENMCSLGIRVSYGAFDWFTSGDLPGQADPGAPPWHALEPGIAGAVGPVDVHVVNHHGSPGVATAGYLETLASTVLVIPSWYAGHPGADVLKRIFGNRFPPAERFVLATDLRPSARIVIGAPVGSLAAPAGNVVIRVEPGGGRYRAIVTSSEDESDTVRAVLGPFDSRP